MSDPFCPSLDVTNITVATTTAATQLIEQPGRGSARIVNRGAGEVFVAFGDSTVTATLNSMVILPGTAETFLMPGDAMYIATIGAAAGSLQVTMGTGL